MPTNIKVESFVDQRALLSEASIVITHGGLNTSSEALAQGLPLLVIPVTNDQPGVAARLVRSGAARRLSVASAQASRIAREVRCLAEDPSYALAAQRQRQLILESPGLDATAKRILEALKFETVKEMGA